MSQNFQKILIIQTAFIGDVILATALIEKMQEHYPNAQLDFLLRKGNEGLLKNHPHIHRVLIWNKKGKFKSLRQVLKQIRTEKYDLLINLQRFLLTGYLAARSKAKLVVGFDKNPFSLFFSKRFPHRFGTDEDPIHEIDRNLSLVAEYTDSQRSFPRLYPSDTDYQKVKVFQAQTYVCIAPTSVWFTKQFPAQNWIELTERLPQDITIYLLGGKGDQKACTQIQTTSRHPDIQVLAGQLSFLESAALMQGAQMNYTNDSAPLHMASAMQAPLTAIFCSTVPRFGFTPLSSSARIVETALGLACRPCGLHGKKACPKGHFDCAKIDVEKLLY